MFILFIENKINFFYLKSYKKEGHNKRIWKLKKEMEVVKTII